MRFAFASILVWLAVGCKPLEPQQTTPIPSDTDSGEPKVLPIDTSVFIPHDSGAAGPPNLTPDHYVYRSQLGRWNMDAATDPQNMSGTLQIEEHIDEIDTAAPAYECQVTYSLTGSASGNNSCDDCSFVFDVEYYVTVGDPS